MKSVPQQYRPRSTVAGALINALLFNLSWLAIVIPHSSRWAPLVVVLHLLVHFRLFGYGPGEARLILMVTVMGLILDQMLFLTRVLTVSGEPALAPLWLTCLWPVLATTLMHAFSTLQQRLVLASAAGGLGGALTYVAGTRLSDVEFASAMWGPVALGLTWAVLFPALLVGASLAAGGQYRNAA
jgi:hypothetical protein